MGMQLLSQGEDQIALAGTRRSRQEHMPAKGGKGQPLLRPVCSETKQQLARSACVCLLEGKEGVGIEFHAISLRQPGQIRQRRQLRMQDRLPQRRDPRIPCEHRQARLRFPDRIRIHSHRRDLVLGQRRAGIPQLGPEQPGLCPGAKDAAAEQVKILLCAKLLRQGSVQIAAPPDLGCQLQVGWPQPAEEKRESAAVLHPAQDPVQHLQMQSFLPDRCRLQGRRSVQLVGGRIDLRLHAAQQQHRCLQTAGDPAGNIRDEPLVPQNRRRKCRVIQRVNAQKAAKPSGLSGQPKLQHPAVPAKSADESRCRRQTFRLRSGNRSVPDLDIHSAHSRSSVSGWLRDASNSWSLLVIPLYSAWAAAVFSRSRTLSVSGVRRSFSRALLRKAPSSR